MKPCYSIIVMCAVIFNSQVYQASIRPAPKVHHLKALPDEGDLSGAIKPTSGKDQMRAFLNSIQDGDSVAFNSLFKPEYVHIKYKDGRGVKETTPLMTASSHGNVEMVNTLLRHGANPNDRRSEDGMTALLAASAKGHTEVVKSLTRAGAILTTPYNSIGHTDTPLYVASKRGHVAVVDHLLGHPVSQDLDHSLFAAVDGGHKGVVQSFLDHDACNYNAIVSAMKIADAQGRQDIKKMLLDHLEKTARKVKMLPSMQEPSQQSVSSTLKVEPVIQGRMRAQRRSDVYIDRSVSRNTDRDDDLPPPLPLRDHTVHPDVFTDRFDQFAPHELAPVRVTRTFAKF